MKGVVSIMSHKEKFSWAGKFQIFIFCVCLSLLLCFFEKSREYNESQREIFMGRKISNINVCLSLLLFFWKKNHCYDIKYLSVFYELTVEVNLVEFNQMCITAQDRQSSI